MVIPGTPACLLAYLAAIVPGVRADNPNFTTVLHEFHDRTPARGHRSADPVRPRVRPRIRRVDLLLHELGRPSGIVDGVISDARNCA